MKISLQQRCPSKIYQKNSESEQDAMNRKEADKIAKSRKRTLEFDEDAVIRKQIDKYAKKTRWSRTMLIYQNQNLSKMYHDQNQRITFFPAMGSTRNKMKYSPRLRDNTIHIDTHTHKLIAVTLHSCSD